VTNYQSNTHNSQSTSPLTLDDLLEAVRLLKRPLLCRIEIGEGMLGFISDMMCRSTPKPLLDETLFGGVPIVDNEWLPPGWARGVDQDGDTLFLMTREHYYDFSKVAKLPYLWSRPFGEYQR
jgi:hypothetical protein